MEDLGRDRYRLSTVAFVGGEVVVDGEAVLMRESENFEKMGKRDE